MKIKIFSKILLYVIIITESCFLYLGISYAAPNENPLVWEVFPYAMNLDKEKPLSNSPNKLMDWASTPLEYNKGGGSFDYYNKMTVIEVEDRSGGVQYFFECSDSNLNSGWIDSATYDKFVSRSGQGLRWRVKARDKYGNETDWNRTGWTPAQ